MTITVTIEINDRPVQVELCFDEPDPSVGYSGGWTVQSAWSGDIEAEDIELTRAQEWEAEGKAAAKVRDDADDALVQRHEQDVMFSGGPS